MVPKRDFFLKENQALKLLREKKVTLIKQSSFSVIKLYVLLSEKVTNLFFTFIIWRLKYDRMLHIRLYLGQSFFSIYEVAHSSQELFTIWL